MQQNKEDRKYDNRRAWLRWVVASVVGGLVTGALLFPVPLFLASSIRPAANPFDYGAILVQICFLLVGLIVSGPISGWVHLLVVGRPAIDVRRWIAKWSAGCYFSLVLVAVAAIVSMNANVEPVERFVDLIGLWTASTLASVVFGLTLSAVLGDTRPDRVRRAPGP